MSSWYSPNVLMMSPDVLNMVSPHASWYPWPQCTEHLPMYSWPSPMHSWYPPMYLTPPCTHDILPMYWTPPDVMNTIDVLNTHYTGWFYVRIKSTNGNILVFFLFICEFMHSWCHTIHFSPVCRKPKKTYLVFVVFPRKMWLFHMEWPSKHSCNYKVTMIIYFLALYS